MRLPDAAARDATAPAALSPASLPTAADARPGIPRPFLLHAAAQSSDGRPSTSTHSTTGTSLQLCRRGRDHDLGLPIRQRHHCHHRSEIWRSP